MNRHRPIGGRTRGLAAVLAALGLAAGPAGAATNAPARQAVLDFRGCILAGLEHSPTLRRSSIEIAVRRLAESDAVWGFSPSLFVNVSYLATRPDYVDSPASLSASTGPYNFIKPYYGIQAAEEFTRIAILVHLQTMAEGVHEIGKAFLQMNAADQAMAVQDDIVRLAERNRAMSESMKGSAGDSLIDRQIAEKGLEESRIEREKLQVMRSSLEDRLVSFLGLPRDARAILVATNARQQVIGQFEPAEATVFMARRNSTGLQIQAIQQKLQAMNIRAAYAKYIPNPVISLRTADPLASDSDSGLYLTLGLEIQVWDGFERSRNVSRQKQVLRQMELDSDKAEQDLLLNWRSAVNQNHIASLDLKATDAQLEIARLRAEKDAIGHDSGRVTVYELQESRMRHLQARRYRIAKNLEYDLSTLYLRHLCGDLRASFINPEALSAELRQGDDLNQEQP